MSITGHGEDKGPTRAGFALCDTIGGMTAAFAVASALPTSGRSPERASSSMCRCSMRPLSFISTRGRRIHDRRPYPPPVRQSVVDRQGHRQPLQEAGDGELMLAVMTELVAIRQSDEGALGREDALGDPRFADWPSRSKNEPALRAIIEDALAADSAKSWEQRLTAMDVPCAGILDDLRDRRPAPATRASRRAAEGALWTKGN